MNKKYISDFTILECINLALLHCVKWNFKFFWQQNLVIRWRSLASGLIITTVLHNPSLPTWHSRYCKMKYYWKCSHCNFPQATLSINQSRRVLRKSEDYCFRFTVTSSTSGKLKYITRRLLSYHGYDHSVNVIIFLKSRPKAWVYICNRPVIVIIIGYCYHCYACYVSDNDADKQRIGLL